LGFVAVLTLVHWFSPKEPNWFPSYAKNDKIPLGTFILWEQLQRYYPNSEIFEVNTPIYNSIDPDSFINTTFFFCDAEFEPDKLDLETLYSFVKNGNHAVISTQKFSQRLLDTLKLKTKYHQFLFDSVYYQINQFPTQKFEAEGERVKLFFSSYDSAQTKVLAKDSKGRPTFIKTRFGDGFFYMNTTPAMLANYNLLKAENYKYVNAFFAALPLGNIIWDEYYKTGRRMVRTPIRYILSHEALRYAWFTLAATVLLFIIFQSKRRQRIIPVIPPMKNDTLHFIHTIGSLYYQNGDHKDLSEKIIRFFFTDIRMKYQLNALNQNEDFISQLSKKSGVNIVELHSLFDEISTMKRRKAVTEEQLLTLNKKIELFFQSL
jgi:hypothetical protein